jgi:hypothetical protein
VTHYDYDPEGFGPEDYPDFFPPAHPWRNALISVSVAAILWALIVEGVQWLWS